MTDQQPCTFDSLGLAPELLKALAEQGYTIPTPIQAQAIPVVLAGGDIMAGAQTGTGKTAAFSLPVIQTLLPVSSSSASPAKHPVRALVLAPTRELAIQVADSIQSYAKHTHLRSLVVFGGVDIKTQTPHLMRGVEILVATPGRLLDHLEQRTVQLGQVQLLVLDEADRMLDMGFMPDLKRILAVLPKKRQTLMFSATFSNEIKKLSEEFLNQPTLIEVARSNATSDNITQKVYLAEQADKPHVLLQLLQQKADTQAIVFTNTKLNASRITRQLQKQGVLAEAIHGDKSQLERMQTLEAFKLGKVHALIATDVAARGLDINELPLVINYELPTSPEDYVHRIGRTGRAGALGMAVSLVSPEEDKYLKEIEKLTKRNIPSETAQVSAHARRASHFRNPELEAETKPAHKRSASVKKSQDSRQDPWFDQPYVPAGDVSTEPSKHMPSSTGKPSTTVAALLGGLGK